MTPKDLLNADLDTVAGWLRAGFDWWIAELSAMTPPFLRRLFAPPARLVALRLGDGDYRLSRRNQPLAEPLAGQTVALALAPQAVLTRELVMPPMPPADLRRAILLDIDRLTPFAADYVYADVRLLARDAASHHGRVQLAVLPRHRAHAILDDARAAGLKPQTMGVAAPGEAAPHFNFMAAIPAALGGAVAPLNRRVWWGMAGGLAALNLLAAIALDSSDVANLRSMVEAQRPAAAAAAALQEKWAAGDKRERLLAQRRATQEPLRMLATLTSALPAGAWVRRLDWNAKNLRLAGDAAAELDVPAALRATPGLADIRSNGNPGAAGDRVLFDVSADWKPGGAP